MMQSITRKQWNYKYLFAALIGTLVIIATGLGACTEQEPTPTSPTVANYTLITTTKPSEGGSVSPSGGRYQSGADVTLTATSSSEYYFDHWKVDGDDIFVNPVTVTITSNKLVIAYFAKDWYTLSTSVSPSGSGSISPSDKSYRRGTDITLTATSSPRYRFDHWSVDGSDTYMNPMTTTMDSDKLVTAYFIETQYTLTTSVIPPDSGSVNPGSGTYDSDDSVVLEATPASGYTFDHWDGDASGTSPSVAIIMDSNKSIIAYFKEAVPTFTLTTEVRPTDGGYVALNPDDGTYNLGTVVTVQAQSASGWQFAGWSGDITVLMVQTVEITMDADKHVIAHFGRIGP